MTSTRNLFAATLIAVCLAVAALADEEPLPVTEAFQYAVSDTGDAFEVDWAIADGYYLYRKRLGFVAGSDAIVLGEPELPDMIGFQRLAIGYNAYLEAESKNIGTMSYYIVAEKPAD